jgi:hypothetical protein
MKFFGYLVAAIVFTVIFIGSSTAVSAQNMQGTVVKKQVKFARGQNKATLRGTAKYGMSYVFNLGAKAGQTMEIRLTGKNSELSFSLIAPDEETMEGGFGVTDWSGELPQSGNYSIIVVMNDENARGVPFTLNVKIN